MNLVSWILLFVVVMTFCLVLRYIVRGGGRKDCCSSCGGGDCHCCRT